MDVPVLKNQSQPGGQDLIETVVSLTGLPDPLVHQELQEVIQLSGQNPSSVTLDELRKAMLLYLETVAAEEGHLEELDAQSTDIS